MLVRIVVVMFSPKCIALCVVSKRLLVGLAVFERLAERELEMKAVIVCQVIALERPAYRPDIILRETEGLEIGKTPVSLAQRRLYLDRAAIRRDAIILASGRLERMAVAHPDLGLLWKFLEERFVDRDRLAVVTEIRKYRGLQCPVGRIARLPGQQALDVRQGLGGFRLPVKYSCVVVAGGTEAGSQLQTALEEYLGVPIAT